jgi:3-hydroxybutyryl-CoA dehydrogenase
MSGELSGVAAVVIGGGRMGAGIVQVLLEADARATLIEADPAGAERARAGILRGLEKRRAKSPSTAPDPEAAIGRLTLAAGLDEVADRLPHTDLFIEAVPEDLDLKRTLLLAAEAALPPAAVVASNTSALSITELSAGMRHPDRFVGMHFFNPVPTSLLIEVVVGKETTTSTAERAGAVARALGKTSITVIDSPGFATSRLGLALGLEAIRMLEEGVASASDIDQAMALGYKHPIGPLRLTDMVGLDVRLAVARHLHARLGDRYEPPALLVAKVERGELGAKAGRGFYDWP